MEIIQLVQAVLQEIIAFPPPGPPGPPCRSEKNFEFGCASSSRRDRYTRASPEKVRGFQPGAYRDSLFARNADRRIYKIRRRLLQRYGQDDAICTRSRLDGDAAEETHTIQAFIIFFDIRLRIES